MGNDYVEVLSELFPEVDKKSIKDIIRVGNKGVIYGLVASNTATISLGGSGNHVLDDMHGDILLYEYHSPYFNNRAKYIKRKKDLRNGDK